VPRGHALKNLILYSRSLNEESNGTRGGDVLS
jgi:hypothetical protein